MANVFCIVVYGVCRRVLIAVNCCAFLTAGLLMTYPGPMQIQGVSLSLKDEASGEESVMYTGDEFYQSKHCSCLPNCEHNRFTIILLLLNFRHKYE